MSTNKLRTIQCLGFHDALSTASAVYSESGGNEQGIPKQTAKGWVVEVYEAEK
jgi:hypothetical protein